MTKRLFLAIDLPEKMKDELVGWQRNLAGESGVRWTPRENLHITVAFLGDIEEDKIGELIEKVKGALRESKPFKLEFRGVVLAPPRGEPRMIWADFFENREFGELAKMIWLAAGDYVLPEIYNKIGEQKIHVTLARFRQPIYLSVLRQPELSEKIFEVGEIFLMESELTPEGPYYKTIFNFKF
ncbi:RNA 2',3'-cyclic phosphodiesterase [Candidatus Kuenenbacteria bacterium]|nr:RNA 2',3'-cyclic phosphodiesterase [Candidatus Kuenenbacteria bacterium]